MAEETNQPTRFVDYLRERNSTQQEAATEVSAFIDHLEKSQIGRAERDANPKYQTELDAAVQYFPLGRKN